MLALSSSAKNVDSVRESQRMLFAFVDKMTEGVVIAQLDAQLIHWNCAALSLHGLTTSEDWSRQRTEFSNIFELSTLAGEIVRFVDWPMTRLLRGEKLDKLQLHVRRLDADWSRILSYSGDVILDRTGN